MKKLLDIDVGAIKPTSGVGGGRAKAGAQYLHALRTSTSSCKTKRHGIPVALDPIIEPGGSCMSSTNNNNNTASTPPRASTRQEDRGNEPLSIGYFDVWPANSRSHAITPNPNEVLKKGPGRRGGNNSNNGDNMSYRHRQAVPNALSRDVESLGTKPTLLLNLESYLSTALSTLALQYPQFVSLNHMANAAPFDRDTATDAFDWLEFRANVVESDSIKRPVGHDSSQHALTLFDDTYLKLGDLAPVQKEAHKSRRAALAQLPPQAREEDAFRRERCSVFQEAAMLFAGGFRTYRNILRWIVDEYEDYITSVVERWAELYKETERLEALVAHKQRCWDKEKADRAASDAHFQTRIDSVEAARDVAQKEWTEMNTMLRDQGRTLDEKLQLLKESEEARTLLGKKTLRLESDVTSLKESLKELPELDRLRNQTDMMTRQISQMNVKLEKLMGDNAALKASALPDMKAYKRNKQTEEVEKRNPLLNIPPPFPLERYVTEVNRGREFIPRALLPLTPFSNIPRELLILPKVRNPHITRDQAHMVANSFLNTVLQNIKSECEEPLFDVLMFSLKEELPSINTMEAVWGLLFYASRDDELTLFLDILFERVHTNVLVHRERLRETCRVSLENKHKRIEVEGVMRGILQPLLSDTDALGIAVVDNITAFLREVLPEEAGEVPYAMILFPPSPEDSPLPQTTQLAFERAVYGVLALSQWHKASQLVDALVDSVDNRAIPEMGDLQKALSKVQPGISSELVEAIIDFVFDQPRMTFDRVVYRVHSLSLVQI
eukprot:PhM_4_TR7109/c0_g1_i1/m.87415